MMKGVHGTKILGKTDLEEPARLKIVPVALETRSTLAGWRKMASQTDCGAEELC